MKKVEKKKKNKFSSLRTISLSEDQKNQLADLSQNANIVINYNKYIHSVSVKDEMRQSLVNDL